MILSKFIYTIKNDRVYFFSEAFILLIVFYYVMVILIKYCVTFLSTFPDGYRDYFHTLAVADDAPSERRMQLPLQYIISSPLYAYSKVSWLDHMALCF